MQKVYAPCRWLNILVAQWLIPVVFLATPVVGYSDTFCFAQAQSYYEQLYCEVKASGKGRSLPNFDQFKRNNPLTQALLLKRPAAAAGIDVAMPKASQGVRREVVLAPVMPSTVRLKDSADAGPIESSSCLIEDQRILCGEQKYGLVGNLNNGKLVRGALDSSNQLGLATYRGDASNAQEIQRYLLGSYHLYLDKMQEIGLGGVTMSYGKFAFLFSDLREKGVDFVERFERMFGFLKKDKRNMSISESLADVNGLKIDDCVPLSSELFVCVFQGRNHLFARLD